MIGANTLSPASCRVHCNFALFCAVVRRCSPGCWLSLFFFTEFSCVRFFFFFVFLLFIGCRFRSVFSPIGAKLCAAQFSLRLILTQAKTCTIFIFYLALFAINACACACACACSHVCMCGMCECVNVCMDAWVHVCLHVCLHVRVHLHYACVCYCVLDVEMI